MSNFCHIHAHSEFSPLDGLSTTSELVRQAVADAQPAMAITDHGVCSGHPAFQRSANAVGIKPIFGLEAYMVNDRLRRSEPMPELPLVDASGHPFKTKKAQGEYHTVLKDVVKARNRALLRGYYHMILLAKNQTGLRNLWALSSETFRSGFYQHPKADWELLAKYSEGIVATTACLRGPVADAILNDDEQLAKARLARLLDIYGDDLYLELHANKLEKQLKVNTALVQMGRDFSVPLVSVVDSHYPTDEAHEAHRAWIACQTNQDINNEGDLFAEDLGLYVKSEAEVRRNLEYLPADAVDQSIANTISIAESCSATVSGKSHTPTFSKVGGVKRDSERLLDVCLSRWDERTRDKRESQDVYVARFEREFRMLKDKGFCGYFLFVWDYVQFAKSQGVLVGPGRGSGGGSLVAYLCGITEIDPVEADLLFERFMTEGRTELPDFDVDFPTSKRDMLQSYLTEKYGEDYVIRVGTHLRLKNKGIVQDLFRALKSTLANPSEAFIDSRKVAKIIDGAESGSAGLGMPWDELWVQHEEELTPFREKYPQVFEMADTLVGRLKSYGKHAAGLVISSDEPLTETIPLRGSEEEQMISQFEMDDLTSLGLVKFDLLTLRTLDTLQVAVDMIFKRHGVRITPYDWKDEYEDQGVYKMLSDGHTLGVFQIETTAMTRITRRLKPWNMNHLADINTLVRPGPMRAGLTESYLRRLAGKEEVVVPHPLLKDSLLRSQGVMLYQEDIMQATMILAGYDSNEADAVRKILGKKLVDKVVSAGKEFVTRASNNGVDRGDAEFIWSQMAEFAKYSFNRAHAYAYAILGFWCAWLKHYYPVEFLAACMSTVKQERIPEFIREARRIGIQVLPPDINESGKGFRVESDTAIRYGLDAIKGIGDKAVEAIMVGQPYRNMTDFRNSKGPKCNSGHVLLLARIGAFDSIYAKRKALVREILYENSGDASRCVFKNESAVEEAPNNLPCTFDWSLEEPEIGRSGKPLKMKPIPKRCTRACRNYSPPPELDPAATPDYTDDDIRILESTLLGAYVTSTPFDRIDPEHLKLLLTADQLDEAPPNMHLVAGIVNSVRKHIDKRGNEMAFLSMMVQTGDVDVVVFSRSWARYSHKITEGVLCLAELEKQHRNDEDSYILSSYMPL